MINYDELSELSGWQLYGNRDELILSEIEKRKKRLAAKRAEIEEKKYEESLILGDLAGCVSYDLCNSSYNLFLGVTANAFWKAWKWANYKDEVKKDKKLSEDEKKEYEDIFEYITYQIKSKILNKDDGYELTGVMLYNQGELYDFEYKYGDAELELRVPVFSFADSKNYSTLLLGYGMLIKTSDISWEMLVQDIDYKKVAEYMKDWATKQHKDDKPE